MISQRDPKWDFGTDATKTKRYVIYYKEQMKVHFRKHELPMKSKEISAKHFSIFSQNQEENIYSERNNEI